VGGAGRVVGGGIEGVDDVGVGFAGDEEAGGQADGGGGVGIEGGAGGLPFGVAGGQVAEGPVVGGEATADAGAQALGGVADAGTLVFLGADGLDGVDVAVTGGGLADGVGGGGEVDFSAGFLDEGDDLVGEGGITAEAVGVGGPEDVKGSGLAVLAELAVGLHRGFGVGPEDEVAGVAGDGVDADDVALEGGGEGAAGLLLVGEGGFVFGGLGLATDGGPDGDAEVGWLVSWLVGWLGG